MEVSQGCPCGSSPGPILLEDHGGHSAVLVEMVNGSSMEENNVPTEGHGLTALRALGSQIVPGPLVVLLKHPQNIHAVRR